jgi:hypothetical protein
MSPYKPFGVKNNTRLNDKVNSYDFSILLQRNLFYFNALRKKELLEWPRVTYRQQQKL